MIKKFIILFIAILIIAGCSKTESVKKETKNNEQKNEKLIIKTNVKNKETKGGYLIYFMPVGKRNEIPGEANQEAFGPFETDENGEYILDLKFNFDKDVGTYLKSISDNKLELFIVTKEDIYIRNPLNEKTIINFIPNETSEPYPDYAYYSKEKEIKIDFIDKYPDNVLSLTFQDAIFVIKLEFERIIPKNSYEVSIFWNDPKQPSGIGIIRVGRISREFQYWDTPFYKSDNLASKTGTIIIKDLSDNSTLEYEGYPKTVSFDKDGMPVRDKIIKLKIK